MWIPSIEFVRGELPLSGKYGAAFEVLLSCDRNE
jgi:hypothetical protein